MILTQKCPSLREGQTRYNQIFFSIWGSSQISSGVKHTSPSANQTVNILELLANINDTLLSADPGQIVIS